MWACISLKSGVGGGIHTYHKYMEEALAGMSLTEVEIETTFLDITTSNSAAKPIMTTAAASVLSDTQYAIQLCMVFYLCGWLLFISYMNFVSFRFISSCSVEKS